MANILTRAKRVVKKPTVFTPEEKKGTKSPKRKPVKKNVFSKKNVNPREVAIQKYVYDLHVVNTPAVLDYNPKTRVIKMENINSLCVSDYFGSSITDIPEDILEMIRNTVETLYNVGVEFSDITGYNFIYDEIKDMIWVIDYGNARFLEDLASAENDDFERDEFVEEFINGLNSWNPAFL